MTQERIKEILPQPDTKHRCINCDGASLRERIRCLGNGVRLSGADILSLRNIITTQEAELREVREALEQADNAIRWALGEGDSDFGDNLPREAPRYWWRKVLREKAGLAWNYAARLSLRATYHTKGEER